MWLYHGFSDVNTLLHGKVGSTYLVSGSEVLHLQCEDSSYAHQIQCVDSLQVLSHCLYTPGYPDKLDQSLGQRRHG